jgi:hypothetical protein
MAATAQAGDETRTGKSAPKPQANPDQIVLEMQFPGPFQDTVIQRWRDTRTGAVCYLYIPVTVPIDKPGPPRSYGANNIGSISCVAGIAGERQ